MHITFQIVKLKHKSLREIILESMVYSFINHMDNKINTYVIVFDYLHYLHSYVNEFCPLHSAHFFTF